MNNFWDERYSNDFYFYGTEPNPQVKAFLNKEKPCSILFVGEGEGRNAVYAAELGYNVTATDLSTEAKRKALLLANKKKVNIEYLVLDLLQEESMDEQFDIVILCFLHLMPELRVLIHQKIKQLLNAKGKVFFVGFATDQIKLGRKSGGPPNIEMLYTSEILKGDFSDFEITKSEQLESQLQEGDGHIGEASLFIFEARKA